MAVNTDITTLTGASCVSLTNNLKVYQRKIDFTVANLASGEWFEIINLPAGAVVIDGSLYVITGQATLTLALGYGGGHELLDATTVATAKTSTAMLHKAVIWGTTADDVSIVAGAATGSTAVVLVTLIVLEHEDQSA